MYRQVALFDTSAGTYNLGDQIIMDYCQQQLRSVFRNDFFIKIPTHYDLWRDGWVAANKADFRIVCGTNILKNHMFHRSSREWRIDPIAGWKLDEVLLMGVGWNNYETESIDSYTKHLYRKLFSKVGIHSVRDNYTKRQLDKLGISNVLYTACPTMWNLDPALCATIPTKKSENVLTTLTDYRRDKKSDSFLLQTLIQKYHKVFVWIQSPADEEYISSLDVAEDVIVKLPPRLDAVDKLLADTSLSLDYVGNRLHCGIRALNNKRRTIIIGVDNRAIEISKDSNLDVIPREDMLTNLQTKIDSEWETNIELPVDNIKKWKSQFINN